jgi:hypothetical protein
MEQQPDPAGEGIEVTQPYPPDVKARHDEEGGQQMSGKTPSTAVGASFETGSGEGAVGYDSPPVTSYQLGNSEVEDTETADNQHAADPYYGPGGGIEPERERREERLGEE